MASQLTDSNAAISERERLDMQHTGIRHMLGDRLILAPVAISEGDQVLETACGSAVWLLDLAKEVPPNVQLYGCDISTSAFPETHPPNVHLSQCSITNLPLEWTNTFVFAHNRLLNTSLTLPMWKQALADLYRVLKPGGWLQLGETEGWYAGPETEAQFAAAKSFVESKGLLFHNVNDRFEEWLEELGFTDITIDRRRVSLRSSTEPPLSNIRTGLLTTFQKMKKVVIEGGGYGYARNYEEYDARSAAMKREWDETDSYMMFRTTFARKPL